MKAGLNETNLAKWYDVVEGLQKTTIELCANIFRMVNRKLKCVEWTTGRRVGSRLGDRVLYWNGNWHANLVLLWFLRREFILVEKPPD
jgi:hypothetical protein